MPKVDLIKRLVKGSPLTHVEMDSNLRKIEDNFLGLPFEHLGLTNADIGKLVVLKNGKTQLPEFEEILLGSKELTVPYIGSFTPFAKPTLIIEFTENLIENDFIEVTMRNSNNVPITQVFVCSLSLSNETHFLQGASVGNSLFNFHEKLAAWMIAQDIDQSYTSELKLNNTIEITASVLSLSNTSNFWGDTSSSAIYIDIQRSGDSLEDRINDSFIGAYFLMGLRYNVDGNPFKLPDFGAAFGTFATRNSNTDIIYAEIGSASTWRLPINSTELLNAIAECLNLSYIGIADANREGNSVQIEFESNTSNFEFTFTDQDQETAFLANFGDILLDDSEAGIIKSCKYPIVGLLSGFAKDGKALLCADKVCKVKLSGDTSIEMEGEIPFAPLLSVGRICVLNPEVPGTVKVLTIENEYEPLNIVPGYVLALEAENDDKEFTGLLSLDTSFLIILFSLGE